MKEGKPVVTKIFEFDFWDQSKLKAIYVEIPDPHEFDGTILKKLIFKGIVFCSPTSEDLYIETLMKKTKLVVAWKGHLEKGN